MQRVSLLGKGGYGNVYLVEKDFKKYAVKVASEKENAYDILRSEKEMLKYLSECEGIPKFIAWKYPDFLNNNENNKMKALYMEYIPGKPLNKIHQQKINIRVLLYDILSLLKYFHDKDIIHGDIKAGNIIMYNDRFYLIDLGFSSHIKYKIGKRGTLMYMAPDFYTKKTKNVDRKAADIFSLGVLAYHRSHFNPPFPNSIKTKDEYGFFYNSGRPLKKSTTSDIEVNNMINNMLELDQYDRKLSSELLLMLE